LAAELERDLNTGVQISPSTGGVFEVEDNGVLIFSKKQLGRFPQEGEIMSIIKSVDNGVPLEGAQESAKEKASARSSQSSFMGWITNQFKG